MLTELSPQSHSNWMQGLAHFLNEEAQVEALLVDIANKKISMATLGKVNISSLEKRLQASLENIENAIQNGLLAGSTNDLKRVSIRSMPKNTLIEKATCLTASKLWTWRNVEWHEAAHEHHHAHDWHFLAILSTICGILGLSAWAVESFSLLPSWVSLALFIASMIAGGWEAATDVLESIPKGKLDIHFLMLCVAVGATFIGAWKEGALLLFLFSFSGALEHFALHKTHSSIDALLKIAPKVANRLEADGTEVTINIDTVQKGHILVVKPGDLFPVDGEIIEGQTSADESNISGEALPISKNIGDIVYSGTLNQWGAVKIVALKPASQSALQKIILLIQKAKHLKAKSQIFTDRFGTPYTYAILAGTLVMFLIWWLGLGLEPFANTPEKHSAFYRAMSLLVVASPCALVLSIPSAILAAIAKAASHGILFRGGAAIEKLAQLDTIALDKTGTLTTGNLEVHTIESFPEGSEDQVLQLAYSLERNANHPIAHAINRYARSKQIKAQEINKFQALIGHGLQGNTDKGICVLGRRELLALGPLEKWISTLPYPDADLTEVWVFQQDILGRILLKDSIRKSSKKVLEVLHKKGLDTIMLTGDHSKAAENVAYQLGIKKFHGGLTPEDKVKIIEELSQNNKKVAMIGDGVNDAPSLAAAYVSVAMGARGSDAALEQSELVLMNDKIENFLEAYDLSIHARKIIYQNLVIALGTILTMVLSASFGMIPLSIGVFAHEGSTVLVCLNSLRLLFKKPYLESLENKP